MVAINYDWDPSFDYVAEEFDDNRLAIAVYTQSPSTYGNVLSQNRSNSSAFLYFDAIGSTRALTDINQSLTDTIVYSAFGVQTSFSGFTEVPFRFGGQLGYYTYGLLSFLNVRFRDIETLIARWLSVDPLWNEHAQTISHYSYSDNNPVLMTDPAGLICQQGWGVPRRRLPGMPSPPGPPGRAPGAPIKWIDYCWALCKIQPDPQKAAKCQAFCNILVKAKIGSCPALFDFCIKLGPPKGTKQNVEACLAWYNAICSGL